MQAFIVDNSTSFPQITYKYNGLKDNYFWQGLDYHPQILVIVLFLVAGVNSRFPTLYIFTDG